jgi:hypothetical protein
MFQVIQTIEYLKEFIRYRLLLDTPAPTGDKHRAVRAFASPLVLRFCGRPLWPAAETPKQTD